MSHEITIKKIASGEFIGRAITHILQSHTVLIQQQSSSDHVDVVSQLNRLLSEIMQTHGLLPIASFVIRNQLGPYEVAKQNFARLEQRKWYGVLYSQSLREFWISQLAQYELVQHELLNEGERKPRGEWERRHPLDILIGKWCSNKIKATNDCLCHVQLALRSATEGKSFAFSQHIEKAYFIAGKFPELKQIVSQLGTIKLPIGPDGLLPIRDESLNTAKAVFQQLQALFIPDVLLGVRWRDFTSIKMLYEFRLREFYTLSAPQMQSDEGYEKLTAVLRVAEEARRFHPGPGHFILAQAYQSIASYFEKLLDDLDKINRVNQTPEYKELVSRVAIFSQQKLDLSFPSGSLLILLQNGEMIQKRIIHHYVKTLTELELCLVLQASCHPVFVNAAYFREATSLFSAIAKLKTQIEVKLKELGCGLHVVEAKKQMLEKTIANSSHSVPSFGCF